MRVATRHGSVRWRMQHQQISAEPLPMTRWIQAPPDEAEMDLSGEKMRVARTLPCEGNTKSTVTRTERAGFALPGQAGATGYLILVNRDKMTKQIFADIDFSKCADQCASNTHTHTKHHSTLVCSHHLSAATFDLQSRFF